MSKKKSVTRKIAIKAARQRGYDEAIYIGQTKDNANVYICTHRLPCRMGLPAFIIVRDGKPNGVDFKGSEFDECLQLLSACNE